jgi:hypothetical protein
MDPVTLILVVVGRLRRRGEKNQPKQKHLAKYEYDQAGNLKVRHNGARSPSGPVPLTPQPILPSAKISGQTTPFPLSALPESTATASATFCSQFFFVTCYSASIAFAVAAPAPAPPTWVTRH